MGRGSAHRGRGGRCRLGRTQLLAARPADVTLNASLTPVGNATGACPARTKWPTTAHLPTGPRPHTSTRPRPSNLKRPNGPSTAGPSPDAPAGPVSEAGVEHLRVEHLRGEGGRDGSVQDCGRGRGVAVRHHVPAVHAVISGDLVPMVAGKEIGPRVKELEPNRRMLRWDGLGEFTREWILDPLDMKAMRLLGSGAAAAGAGILTYGAWSAASWARYGHTHPERPPARSSPPSTSRATSRSSTPSPPTRSAPTGPASSPAPGWSPPIRNPEGGSGATGRRCQPGSSSSGT
jgi:hypothetical protein